MSAAALPSMKNLLSTAYIIDAKGPHQHSLIWLHGFGDSSDGYKEIFAQIQPPNTRIVLPNAPKRWHTIQGRPHFLQSWYGEEVLAIEYGLPVIEAINELIEEELKLVKDASHIILGGFSQGACLALMAGLKYERQQLGGIICCSGQVAYQEHLNSFLSSHARKMSILIVHGKEDDRLVWDEAKKGYDLLRMHGFQDNLQVIVDERVGHTISQRGFNAIYTFMVKQLKL